MADYFEEMSWTPLPEGAAPDHRLQLARILHEFNRFETFNTEQLAPPASKEAVERLENIEIVENGTQCPVCLKEHEKGEVAKKLPCKHQYHTECIIPWLMKTNSCPLCRFELPTDDEDYEAFMKEKKRAKEREAELENLHNSMFT